MTEPFLLRVVPALLARGRIAGQVVHVASGEVCRVRDVADLLEFLARTAAPGTDPDRQPDAPEDDPDA